MLECNSPSHKLVRSLEEISGVDVLVAPDPGAVSIGRLYAGRNISHFSYSRFWGIKNYLHSRPSNFM